MSIQSDVGIAPRPLTPAAVKSGYDRCTCRETCGDDGDIDGPGVCKGLPIERTPLVEIVLVPRRLRDS